MYDLLDMSYRQDGLPFDCIPNKVALVDHINNEKLIVHFIVNKSISGIMKMSVCNEKLNIGDVIAVKIIEMKGDKGNYFQAITCEKTDEQPEPGLKRTYSGEFDGNKSFGFADDVYIPSHLLKDGFIDAGDFVGGEAILSYNKKKGKWGWTAISVS